MTFQEYFTARYVVENAHRGSLEGLISGHLHDPKWREVFLLTAEMLNNADEFFEQFLFTVDEYTKHSKRIQELLDKIKLNTRDLNTEYTLFQERNIAVYATLNVSFNLALALALARARALYNKAINLSKQIGLSELTRDLQSISLPNKKAKSEEWKLYADSLWEIFKKHRPVEDYEFTKEEADNLSTYLEANKLLLDCLKNARVNDREAIKDRLLRPVGESPEPRTEATRHI